MSRIQTAGQAEAVSQSKFELIRIIEPVLLAPDSEESVGWLASDQFIPIQCPNEGSQIRRALACSIESTDEATHARSGNQLSWNTVFLQPLKDADMGESFRPSALKCKANTRPIGIG